MVQQSRRLQPNGREMRGATDANREPLGTRQVRGIRDLEGKPMANEEIDVTGEKEGAEEQSDVAMTETAGEIEMGATASND